MSQCDETSVGSRVSSGRNAPKCGNGATSGVSWALHVVRGHGDRGMMAVETSNGSARLVDDLVQFVARRHGAAVTNALKGEAI